MKIVLVHHKDPNDINVYSGISFFMTQAIKKEFEEVIEFNDFEPANMTRKILNGNYKASLSPFGLNLTRFLRSENIKADYIICQGGNTSIPYYDHDIPIAYWHDSSWNTLWRDHTDNSSFLDSKKFKRFKQDFKPLYNWDKQAMERADLVVFSSHYIAEACNSNYKIPLSKIKVIPFGANLLAPPVIAQLNNWLEGRATGDTLNLTFLGKDWVRKGLVTAYKLTCKLNAAGIKTQLNVIGCIPTDENIINSPFTKIIGFIDKSLPGHQDKLDQVLQNTHFLIHPAIAEPFGIALCEANAYGIPVIGTNVDGLKTIVVNGQNGYLFKKNKFIHQASLLIKDIYTNFDRLYRPLFRSTLEAYEERLNWETNVRSLKKILAEQS